MHHPPLLYFSFRDHSGPKFHFFFFFFFSSSSVQVVASQVLPTLLASSCPHPLQISSSPSFLVASPFLLLPCFSYFFIPFSL